MAPHPLIRRTARGGAWLTLGTVVTQSAQLGYAAVTSRLLDPGAFGAYAVALTVLGLVNIVARAGLDEAVARSGDPTERSVRVAGTWAIGIGVLFAGLVWVSAPAWAALFDTPAAVEVLRPISIAVLFTPYFALISGVARAQNRFRQWTLANIGWMLAGLLAGIAVVLDHRTPAALVIPLITQTVGMTLSHPLFVGHAVVPAMGLRTGATHIRFGSKVTSASLIEYAGMMASQISVSNGVSTAALGQWNRAGAFAVTPIWAMVQAFTRAIFPELGERWNRAEGTGVLSAISYLSTWIGLLGALWWGSLVSVTLPILIGSQWELATTLSVPLALTAGLAFAAAPLISALQAGDEFRGYLRAQVLCLVVLLLAAATTWLTGEILFVAVAYPLTGMMRLLLVRHEARRCTLVDEHLPVPRPPATIAVVGLGLVAAGCMLTSTLSPQATVGLVVATTAVAVLSTIIWWRDPGTRLAVGQLRTHQT